MLIRTTVLLFACSSFALASSIESRVNQLETQVSALQSLAEVANDNTCITQVDGNSLTGKTQALKLTGETWKATDGHYFVGNFEFQVFKQFVDTAGNTLLAIRVWAPNLRTERCANFVVRANDVLLF